MVNNIPVNGWPQLKDLEAVQPTLDRLDKIEAWKRTVKEETFTGDDITIENALALPARSLITSINAIQDLHGLPFPYVGGAYKNKFNPNFTGVTGITPSVDSNGYLILTVSGAVSVTFLKGQSIALKANTAYTLSCVGASANAKVSLRNSDGSTVYASVEVDGGSSTYTPTEDITVYFYIRVETSAALTATLKPQLEEGSSATSFAPYSNICPISGRDSVAVDDVGKNLTEDKISGCNLLSNGGIITDSTFDMQIAKVKQGETYVITTDDTSGAVYGFFTSKPVQGSTSYNGTRYVTAVKTFTAPITGYVAYRTFANYATPQCEIGTTPTPYQPYAHSSATIQLGQTVYGADINWDTGVMTLISAKKVLTASDVTGVSGNQKRMNISISGVRNAASDSVADDIIQSDKFKALSSNDTYSGNIGISVNTLGGISIAIGEDLTLESAQQYVTANAIEVVYPLATPTTIQLSPEQLQMLKGYNRITLSDGYGTIELKALTGANWS